MNEYGLHVLESTGEPCETRRGPKVICSLILTLIVQLREKRKANTPRLDLYKWITIFIRRKQTSATTNEYVYCIITLDCHI